MRKVTIQLTVQVDLSVADDASLQEVVDSFDLNIYRPDESTYTIEGHTTVGWLPDPTGEIS